MKIFLFFIALIFAQIANATNEGRLNSIYIPSKSEKFDYSLIEDLIVFGDSYSTTGVSYNTLKYSGNTYAAGENWALQLINLHDMRLWNFACGGASITLSYMNVNLCYSFEEQYEKFSNTMTAGKTFNEWESKKTLFVIWFGINDIIHTKISDDKTIEESTKVLYDTVSKLYENGAKNILFINVPPFEKSPYGLDQNMTPDFITKFNNGVKAKITEFSSKHVDTNIFIYNSNDEFNYIMENKEQYNITDVTSWDPELRHINYFWVDNLHPFFTVHGVLAKDIHNFLNENSVTKVELSTTHEKAQYNKSSGCSNSKIISFNFLFVFFIYFIYHFA